MHARTFTLAALVAASTALAACSGDNVLGLGVAGGVTRTDSLNVARVRFVNATGTSYDVATAGVVGTGNGALDFGAASSCISTDATTPNLAVRQTGTTSALPGLELALQAGRRYLVVAHPDASGGTRFATIVDTYAAVAGQTGLRVFNAATATYDVYVTVPGASLATAAPTIATVTSGAISTTAAASTSATQQVRLTASGSRTVVLDVGNVAFVAGRNVLLVIAPPVLGQSTPRAFLVAWC